MGYIRHNAIIVTGDSYPEAREKFELVHSKAKELLGQLVSETIPALVNGYQSFMVAPDGSKEGWEPSNDNEEKRKELMDYIDSLAYDDGSNAVQFVDVCFDECYEVEIDRSNKREGEVFE